MTLQLNSAQMAAARRLLANRMSGFDQPGSIYSGGYGMSSVNAKHNVYYDFGYPAPGELTFQYFYAQYRRHGIAKALVDKTGLKTWQDKPYVRMMPKGSDETSTEQELREHLDRIRFWQHMMETDKRSMVGKYAGVILQLGDGKDYNRPVDRVRGGVKGLISVLPAWEGQLEPSEWDTNPVSENYGQPKMYRFNESSVDPEQGKVRSFSVHPDRVLLWSEDGTTWGESKLEPIYNALMDVEKIRGAGGEGFWKIAKAQPVLNADPSLDFNQLAQMFGVELDELPDKLDEVIGRWSKGFDESLVTQGMDVKALGLQMPTDPERYWSIAVQEISAAWPIPQKVLTGMQTGERASTEDAREWAQTNKSRQTNICIPNLMELFARMQRWGMLPVGDWWIDWGDLTAPTLEEKLTIVKKMAEVNQAMFATGDAVFTDDEMREVAGYDKLSDGESALGLPEGDEGQDLDDEPEDEAGDGQAT